MQRISEELETLKNNGQYRSIPDIFCKANNKKSTARFFTPGCTFMKGLFEDYFIKLHMIY